MRGIEQVSKVTWESPFTILGSSGLEPGIELTPPYREGWFEFTLAGAYALRGAHRDTYSQSPLLRAYAARVYARSGGLLHLAVRREA